LGAPSELRVLVLGAPREPWCLDARLFYTVMYIIFLSDVSLCNCVAPPFGFWYIHIDLSKKKKVLDIRFR
jgi:hypothetical protein